MRRTGRRVRTVVLAAAAVVAVAACSSSAKPGAQVRAASVSAGSLGLGGSPGLAASGSAKQTVKADLAAVVLAVNGAPASSSTSTTFTFSGDGVPSFPVPTEDGGTPPDHDVVRAALRPLGIAADAVTFTDHDPSVIGPDTTSIIRVEVPVAKLPAIGHAIVDALRSAQVGVVSSGLRFAVADCAAAMSSARGAALTNARDRAEQLAAAAEVKLGDLVAVSETQGLGTLVSYTGANHCGSGALAPDNSVRQSFAALDADPTVELTETVRAVWAIGAAPDRMMSAEGTGTATGPADSADLIVASQSGSVVLNGVEQSNAIDGAAVERALAPLGVAEHDIEVENPIDLSFASSASPYVRVHLSVGALRAKGKQILAAVKRFVPGDAAGSVVFASSRCTQVLAQAQRAAVADAGKRLDSLAAAAHVHLGGVAGVSGNPSTELYLPGADACRPDLDLLVGTGLLSGAASFSGVPVPVAVDLDAPARITETVSIDVARAIT